MDEDEKKALGCLLGIPAFLIVAPICAVMYGGTLTVLWRWFIVPTFGLPALTLLQSIGVMLVMHVFTIKRSPTTKEEQDKSVLQTVMEGLTFGILFCGLSLLEGWIVLKFMGR